METTEKIVLEDDKKNYWKELILEFDAKNILREALKCEDVNIADTNISDNDFLFGVDPYKAIAHMDVDDDIPIKIPKTDPEAPENYFYKKVEQMFRKINKIRSEQNIDNNNKKRKNIKELDYTALYYKGEVEEENKDGNAIYPKMWKDINKNTKTEKRGIFSVAFGIFYIQEKIAKDHFTTEERIKDLEELLYIKEKTFNYKRPPLKLFDIVIYDCIKNRIFKQGIVNDVYIDYINSIINEMNTHYKTPLYDTLPKLGRLPDPKRNPWGKGRSKKNDKHH
uniref:Uncharacterized protein n=1 Tax=uncultured bacterium contig00043 TaxID=1181530 RepID=A0A806KDE9_9BACT|nr:hypothetical protein [uncultured bacterium contig00043]